VLKITGDAASMQPACLLDRAQDAVNVKPVFMKLVLLVSRTILTRPALKTTGDVLLTLSAQIMAMASLVPADQASLGMDSLVKGPL